MRKRGQAALLAAAGLIILFLSILFFYYRESVLLSKWEKERAESMIVPDEAKELHNYVYSCVQDISERGLTLLGLQGGYIILPKDNFVKGPSNPFSTSLEIIPQSGLRASYWFYESPNKVQKVSMPTLTSMGEELGAYVDDNLAACLGKFEGFEDYKIKTGEISAKVDIKDKAVYFTVSFPISVSKATFNYEFEKFYYSSDVPLGEMYQAASEILSAENENFFFEELTIDSLVLYDAIPYSDLDFKCETKIWTKPKVKESLKEILQTNIEAVKLKGSDYLPKMDDKGYYTFGIRNTHRDLKAYFKYSTKWPIYMEVYPSKGELIKGDEITKFGKNPALSLLSSIFCLTSYHFVYDIKYPLLITLQDMNGYTFQYATQVIIDNNQPRENRLGAANLEDSESEICTSADSKWKVYALKMNPDETVTPIEDAEISFKCITTVCNPGQTKKEEDDVYFEGKFPACVNGLLTAEKEGYHSGKVFLDTNSQGEVSVILDKIYQMPFEVRIIDKNGNIRSPGENEKIVFELSEKEKGFSSTALWPNENNKVSLISGNYEAKSYIIEDSPFPIVIQSQEVEQCTESPINLLGIFGEEKCENVKIPSTVLEQTIKGGASFKWDVTTSELGRASKIIFYTVSDKVPSSYDELSEVYESIEDRQDSKKPELVI